METRPQEQARRALPLILGALVTGSALVVVTLVIRQRASEESDGFRAPTRFRELLALSPEQLARVDMALVNLLCAEGLPGAEKLDIPQCLTVLNRWARDVDSETERNLHRFRENPSEGDNSEAKWRMLMLVTVLQQDFQVQYNPSRIEAPGTSSPNDEFFADSRDVFLGGLLGPRHMGSCSSMPVLYAAIGRRLGYPIKLAATKGHLFVRWEDLSGKERFNFEGSGHGGGFHPDEYYRQWPFPVSEHEIEAGHYLKSMAPQEELAVFLTIRGLVLKSSSRLSEARLAFDRAHALVPESLEYSYYLATTLTEKRAGLAGTPQGRGQMEVAQKR